MADAGASVREAGALSAEPRSRAARRQLLARNEVVETPTQREERLAASVGVDPCVRARANAGTRAHARARKRTREAHSAPRTHAYRLRLPSARTRTLTDKDTLARVRVQLTHARVRVWTCTLTHSHIFHACTRARTCGCRYREVREMHRRVQRVHGAAAAKGRREALGGGGGSDWDARRLSANRRRKLRESPAAAEHRARVAHMHRRMAALGTRAERAKNAHDPSVYPVFLRREGAMRPASACGKTGAAQEANSARPSSARPSSARPSSARPSSARPNSARPSSARPSSARPSGARQGGVRVIESADPYRDFKRSMLDTIVGQRIYQVRVSTRARVCAVPMRACVCACLRACVPPRTHTHLHARARVRTQKHAHAHAHAHAQTHRVRRLRRPLTPGFLLTAAAQEDLLTELFNSYLRLNSSAHRATIQRAIDDVRAELDLSV